MGDRGNIVIETTDRQPIMHMYSHWSGSCIPERVAAALVKGKSRWDDDSYLNRVLFQTLLNGDDGVTGYGLSIGCTDSNGERNEVQVCHEAQRVRYMGRSYTFAEFTPAKAAELTRQD